TGVRVGHVAQFLDGFLNLLAQVLRDAFWLAQRPRYGDGADPCPAGHIGNGGPPAAASCARTVHGAPPSNRSNPPRPSASTATVPVALCTVGTPPPVSTQLFKAVPILTLISCLQISRPYSWPGCHGQQLRIPHSSTLARCICAFPTLHSDGSEKEKPGQAPAFRTRNGSVETPS